MPVKTDKKPVAKKPVGRPKKVVPAPKPVEKPKAQAPKAPKAEPKADKRKTISAEEFHNLAIDRSYEIWQERSKSGKPGDQNSDWDQAVSELKKLYLVK